MCLVLTIRIIKIFDLQICLAFFTLSVLASHWFTYLGPIRFTYNSQNYLYVNKCQSCEFIYMNIATFSFQKLAKICTIEQIWTSITQKMAYLGRFAYSIWRNTYIHPIRMLAYVQFNLHKFVRFSYSHKLDVHNLAIC